MKKSISIILQSILVIFVSYSYCFAESSCGLVNRANSLYKQKKYDEAIKLYNEAQIKSPDSAEINYNIGIAQYKKEDYLLAVSFLEKATVSKDKILESRANFNIGNAKYKLGKLKENTDLKETVNLLRQSLDYYKRAIELDSKDEDARVNHELVEKELKMLLDKLKQEQDRKKEESEQ
ncbi:MAG: tetratricopeptide repeat protein, partial [Candidatus Omnitrophota bacterium]